MNRTKIEWTDYTWNFVTGCLHGCEFCYARKICNRFRKKYLAQPNVAPGCDPTDPFAPRFWHARRNEPLSLKKPSKIFVVDMGDLFGDWVPAEWINMGLTIVWHCSQHTFQFLTKAPHNLAKWNPWPPNAWVGATATNRVQCNAAISGIAKTDARVKFISFEPLLGPISTNLSDINWIIIGAQTNPERQPAREWIQAILDEADRCGIPVFLKDNLKWPNRRREWPELTTTNHFQG